MTPFRFDLSTEMEETLITRQMCSCFKLFVGSVVYRRFASVIAMYQIIEMFEITY